MTTLSGSGWRERATQVSSTSQTWQRHFGVPLASFSAAGLTKPRMQPISSYLEQSRLPDLVVLRIFLCAPCACHMQFGPPRQISGRPEVIRNRIRFYMTAKHFSNVASWVGRCSSRSCRVKDSVRMLRMLRALCSVVFLALCYTRKSAVNATVPKSRPSEQSELSRCTGNYSAVH